MKTQVKPIPEGYEGATPYLHVHDAAAAIDFYKKAFGATELMRMTNPSGKVDHAEIRIGKGIIMLSDESPDMGAVGPKRLGGTPVGVMLYFEDVDAVAKRAVAAGGKLTRAIEDQFYGDRSGKLEDPFGHSWWIATHKEDVSPEEMKKRVTALYGAS
jgi:PhnB protein